MFRGLLKVRSLSIMLVFALLLGCVSSGESKGKTNKSKANSMGESKGGNMQIIRSAQFAGSWYPSNPSELKNMLNNFFDAASVNPIEGRIQIIISPHAGYIFSGPVAAYGFKALKMNKEMYKGNTVILIGFAHRSPPWYGLSVWEKGEWRTPLGSVEVDSVLARKVMSYNPDILNFKREIFDREHSLELEIPFLQFALDNDFKLLPISFAQQGMAVVETLINALVTSDINWDRTIIVLSTDMSHYHSYEEAMKIDKKTLDYVLKNDIEGLEKWMMSGNDAFCGWGPVITGMAVSESLGWDKPILLRYANSGDTSPESKSRGVVGYCSVVFVRNGNYKMSSKSDGDEYSLTHDQKKYLLKLARKTIEEYIINGRKYEPPKPTEPKLIEDTPVFVTLHRKGMLRGCIGQMIAQEPLYLAVRNMAISAATRDPRFSPVPSKQLNEVDIEISVLSPMIKVNSYEDVVPNKHGIYIKRGYRTGVFLPQVWEHFNNRDGFLSELCSQKAMLERDCYKKSETEIYVFTVLEFDEKQYGLK